MTTSLPVIPPVRSFEPGDGNVFTLTGHARIHALDTALLPEADLLIEELSLAAADADPAAGDIVLRLGEVESVSSGEGYSIVVDEVVTVSAPTRRGVFHGTRTLLQLFAAGPLMPGTIVDEPTVEVRSLHLDAARKYFTPGWLHELIREMAAVKLNQLQYHFSENEGFRLESTSHPEIVSDEHITQAELTDLLETAARYHVEVVPALDVPGHMAQALRAHPEWAASDTDEGRRILDYSRPEVRRFVEELVDEFAPLFPSTAWHLGGDEVFQLDSSPLEDRFPHLHAYARDSVGPDATVMDGYVHYLNTVAEHLRANGKTQVRAWNDAVHTPGTTVALNEDIAYWTMWHESMPSVETLLRHGHRLINFSDRYFYYVLTSPDRAYFTKPSAEAIHAEWTPGTFPGPRGGEPQMIADDDAALLGASFSIWCDVPDAETQQEVAEGIRMPLRAMASKSWNPASTETYSDWSVRASSF